VYLPVEIPDLSDGDLQMGGIVIGSDLRRAPTLGAPPLLRTPLPFQPTLSREFSTAETLRLFTRLRWDIDEGEPTVSVALRGDALVATREVAVLDPRDDRRERDGTIDTITVTLPATRSHKYGKTGVYELKAVAEPPCRGQAAATVEIKR